MQADSTLNAPGAGAHGTWIACASCVWSDLECLWLAVCDPLLRTSPKQRLCSTDNHRSSAKRSLQPIVKTPNPPLLLSADRSLKGIG